MNHEEEEVHDEESYDLRQYALIHNPDRVSALIIGAGSIGSVCTVLMARTGIGRIVLYDDDILENWNCTGGLFDTSYIGRPKVESVKSLAKIVTGRDIEIHNEKFTRTTEVENFDIVLVGVDSMSTRRLLWDCLMDQRSWDTYIDARMGGHVCEVFTFRRRDTEKHEWYQDTLGVKVAPMACGTEATSYVLERLSSMVGRSMRSVTNRERSTPFRQYWDGEYDSEFVSENSSRRLSIAA